MTRLGGHLKTTVAFVSDQLWPPTCAACDTPTQNTGGVCLDCWEALTFLAAPQCACCGIPFPFDLGPRALCGECTRARPAFDRARAAFVYDDVSRSMILAFKHADRTDLTGVLAGWMHRPAVPLLRDADIVVPVPLHWKRMLSRRYNQAALLANRLARGHGVRIMPDLVRRKKQTGTQGGKSASARRRNVQGAFSVPQKFRARIRDKRILVVDDVMTTGATVDAVARTLLRAGAGAVDVITIARALK